MMNTTLEGSWTWLDVKAVMRDLRSSGIECNETAGGVNDAGREFSPSPVSLPWDFQKEGMKTLIARYCHAVN